MIAYTLAVFFLLITPGPGVLSAAGMGAGFGFRAALRYVLGLWIGTNLVALAVISGLAALVLALDWLRLPLLFASSAYLAYLAFRIATAGKHIAFIEAKSPPGIASGILLQALNPKAYAVNLTLFSGFAFLPQSPGLEVGIKLVIFSALWVPVHFAWSWAGAKLREMDLPERWHERINMAMAAAMLAVVALALASQL